MKNNYIIGWLLWVCPYLLWAQQPTHVLQNVTIHVGNGQIIEKGVLVFADGKILHVGEKLNGQYKNAVYFDLEGKHVYPGLICMNTLLGLNELDAVRATRDYQETGTINPNVRALIAYNTDSKLTPTARFNGILYIQPVPQGGLISGSSSLVRTTAWNWEDAVLKADEGIHLNWPEIQAWGDTEKQKERIGQLKLQLSDFFTQAQAYGKGQQAESINLRYESMRPVFEGKSNVYVHVKTAKGILGAIQFFKSYPTIRVVLTGAEEADRVADEILASGYPVVLDMTHRLPPFAHDAVDQPYQLPALLFRKGIKVALGHGGSWESRNLMFNAGTVSAYGLTKEEALQLITKNPAEIMGCSQQIGTLVAGSNASLIVTTGDVLDMKSGSVLMAFQDGKVVELNADQQKLYEKFMNKYGLKP